MKRSGITSLRFIYNIIIEKIRFYSSYPSVARISCSDIVLCIR